MKIEFEVGDVVSLKSGSPKMTVVAVRSSVRSNGHCSIIDLVYFDYDSREYCSIKDQDSAIFVLKAD